MTTSVPPASIGRLERDQITMRESHTSHAEAVKNALSDGRVGEYSKRDAAAVISLELQTEQLSNQINNNRAIEHTLRPIASQLQSIREIHSRMFTEAFKMRSDDQASYYNIYRPLIDNAIDELNSILSQTNINGEYSMSGVNTDKATILPTLANGLQDLADITLGNTLAVTDYYNGGSTGGTIYLDAEGTEITKAPVTGANEGIRLLIQSLLKMRGSNATADRPALFGEIIGELETSSKQLGIAMSQVSVPLHHVGKVNQRLESERIGAETNLGTMQAQSSIDAMLSMKQQEVVQDIARSLLQQKAAGISRMIAVLDRT